MSAESIDIFAVSFGDPGESRRLRDQARSATNNSSSSYNLYISDNIRTLSTNSVGDGNSLEGILYVPDLPLSDPCTNISAQYIPQNVTRRTNLPQGRYPLVAFAPWIVTTPNCTISYLAAARDAASAFIFFLTDNRNGMPPPVNDPTWKLNDGGSWKSENHIPVYAISNQVGGIVMHELSVYSESPRSTSQGGIWTADRAANNYVRIYAMIVISTQSNLPSLWAFLLIVLGVVLFLVGLTSISMHCIQRRNRRALHRRVAAGEVDLEALGIKRLTVPQEALDKLLSFIYVQNEMQPPDAQPKRLPGATSEVSPDCLTLSKVAPQRRSVSEPLHTLTPLSDNRPSTPGSSHSAPSRTHRQVIYSQPTCPICLEDFESHRTLVRELPCRHIYHPSCIDTFLLENSSLCPVCKKRVLDRNFCPEKITNAMVRSERRLRRRQEREALEALPQRGTNNGSARAALVDRPLFVGRGRRQMASFHRQFGWGNSGSGGRFSSALTAPSAVELSDRSIVTNNDPAPAVATPRTNVDSHEWRARVNALDGHRSTADDEDRERRAGMSRWRKAVGSVFPGFH